MEPVSGTPNTVGAVSNIFVEDSGEEMMMVETITAFEENNKIAMTFTMDFMNMDYEMLLKEKEGKTIISTKSKVTGNGFVAKSIISFISSSMKKQEDENLNNLKKLIDENTKDYFPEPVPVSSEEAVEL